MALFMMKVEFNLQFVYEAAARRGFESIESLV